MKSYLSFSYLLVLLPLALLCYQIVPRRIRRYVLLLMNLCFIFYFSRKGSVFIVLSALSIYGAGLWIEKLSRQQKQAVAGLERSARKALKQQYTKKQRRVLALAVVFNIGILLVLKYAGFFMTNVYAVLGKSDGIIPRFMQPIGLSFYTMSAVSYVTDVYRGQIEADHDLVRLALFLSFFPTIMEGPICRYSDTAVSINEARRIRYEDLTRGAQRIVWGLAKKLIVADRLNNLIKTVFLHYDRYDGTVMALAAILYTVQLYMEFSGTIDAVIGTGEIFGVRIPENFRQPFFSVSISDFWARWHITLGTWFRDYIYYPVSMSGPLKQLTMKSRKKLGNYYGPMLSGLIALFAVWLANGLWHGSAWSFIFFGMYHFALLMVGRLCEPGIVRLLQWLHIDRDCKAYRAFRIVRTAVLVMIGELFFRAHGLRAGFAMFGRLCTSFQMRTLLDGTLLTLGMDIKDYVIIALFLLLVLWVGIQHEKGVSLRDQIAARPVALRWTLYYALLLAVVIFGAYGPGYVGIDPIYAGF